MRRSEPRPPYPRLAMLLALAGLTGVAAAVGHAVVVESASTGDRRRVHAQDEAKVHLPFVWRGVARAELVAPREVVPTRPPSATPTSEEPATAPPTFTAIPSVTPTPAGDGFIGGRILLGKDPAPAGMGDGFGPGLFLLKCKEGRKPCERVGRTPVLDEEGHYKFQNPAALADDETYVVHWRNETYGDLFGLREWLGAWYSEAITPQRYTPGAEITIEDFQLEPIELTGPSNGTGYSGLPWTFTWDPRKNEIGTYRWAICDCFGDGLHHRDTDKSFKSPSVGRNGAYTMANYPDFIRRAGIGIEHKYFWYVHVDGPRGSWGQSHDQWMLWFESVFQAFRPFGVTGFSRWQRVDSAGAASIAQTGAFDAHVFMPSVWRNVDRVELPAAVVAPPEPTATRPPVVAATPTSATPTEVPATDEPTVVPTEIPPPTPIKPATGTIRGRYVKQGVPLSPGYGADSFPQIELKVRTGGVGQWTKVANAVTVEDGAFAFEAPPALEEDQVYQVWWTNDDTIVLYDTEALGRWYSRNITPDQMAEGKDVDLGTVELRDLELKFPENDVHYSLPHDYRWETRSEVPTENYRWTLYKTCNDLSERFPSGSHRTPSLGHRGTINISSPPQGFKMDERYCWYVYIEDNQGRGSGWTYYRYKTIFLSALARAAGGMGGALDVERWVEAR